MEHRKVSYGRGETLFTQGDPCGDVLFIERGRVQLSVQSATGSEAVLATLGRGDFLGEGCLAGQRLRTGSATAVAASVVVVIGRDQMARLLREQHTMADRFIAHLLSRHVQIEEALIDQLCTSTA
jgi:CRP/FNR family cyclic AMP-dependent transcriptional regulator